MENQVEHVHQVPEKTAEELVKEFMNILHNFEGPIRKKDENFSDYKTRVAKENAVIKGYLKGRVVWAGRHTYIKSVHGELK